MSQPHHVAHISAETVVLVHGLAAPKVAMWPLGRYLNRQGFQVVNWGYPSITQSIETHALRLAEMLGRLEQLPSGTPYHLVTHSMGSIIARTALHYLDRGQGGAAAHPSVATTVPQPWSSGGGEPAVGQPHATETGRLKYIVMLGPPNRGSPVARVLAPYLGWLCPPLHELADRTSSYVNQLTVPSRGRLGIVAAASDLVVPLRSTFLSADADHIVVPGMHSGILFSRQAASEVSHFLRHGCFRPEAKRPDPELFRGPATGTITDPLCT
jgi:pimeloyl-ACP methyl ester carboxylesterase